MLKYRPGKLAPSFCLQMVDLDRGEAVISRSKTVEGPSEVFVGSLVGCVGAVPVSRALEQMSARCRSGRVEVAILRWSLRTAEKGTIFTTLRPSLTPSG